MIAVVIGTVSAMAATVERQILSLLGELIGIVDLEQFSFAMLGALRGAVPAEFGALNEVPADFPGAISITEPPAPLQMHEVFAQYALQNPIAAHFLATGDGRATRFSDLITQRELHNLDLYKLVYRELGVEYQIAFTLPSERGRVLGAVLSRSSRDFTDAERDLLNRARPYLIQLYRAATERRDADERSVSVMSLASLQSLGLSRRQAETLRLVAFGRSAPEAGRVLGISPRTAQKHLELCYRVLRVSSRSDAVAAAWNAARST